MRANVDRMQATRVLLEWHESERRRALVDPSGIRCERETKNMLGVTTWIPIEISTAKIFARAVIKMAFEEHPQMLAGAEDTRLVDLGSLTETGRWIPELKIERPPSIVDMRSGHPYR